MSTINVNLWELTDTELIGALNYEIWKFGPTGNRPVSSWDERIEMHGEPVSRLYLENGCYENEPAKIIGLFEKKYEETIGKSYVSFEDFFNRFFSFPYTRNTVTSNLSLT